MTNVKFFNYTFDEIRSFHKELMDEKELCIDDATLMINENNDGTVDGCMKFCGGVELNIFCIPIEALLLMFLSHVESQIEDKRVYMTYYHSICEAEKRLTKYEKGVMFL